MTLAMLLASSAVPAQVDPLRAPGCLAALEALCKAEDAAAAVMAAGSPPPGLGSALTAARRRVGTVCLGSADLTPPPARVRLPLTVDSSPPLPAIALRLLGPLDVMVPAVPTRPLVTLSGCDPAGCWASDGPACNGRGRFCSGRVATVQRWAQC